MACRLEQLLGKSLIAIAMLYWASAALAVDDRPLLAFPGAEGFHTELCTHERGGRVLIVTSLADSKKGPPAEGTFRWACESFDEPRIVVFRVGGVIELQKEVAVKPNIYLAGQTAPGDGICITQAGLRLSSNSLGRHLRFRLGDKMPGAALTKRDGFESHGDNIIIDHCSIAWSTDECFRINGGENICLAWCFLGEGLHITRRAEMHNYGPALEPNFASGGETKNLAFHHCLLNGFAARSPLIGNGDREVHMLFANNVLYNYGGMKYPPLHTYAPKKGGPKKGAAFGTIDVIGNFFKAGPSTPVEAPVIQVHGDYPNGSVYLADNVSENSPQPSKDAWDTLMADSGLPSVQARRALEPHHALPSLTSFTADDAFEQVLQKAGATVPKRDTVDQRFASDVRSGTRLRGILGSRAGGDFRAYYDYIYADPAEVWKYHVEGPHYNLGMKLEDLDPVPNAKEYFSSFAGGESPMDSDQDGLPDEWEKAHGLDPQQSSDNLQRMPSRYTAIEEYLNDLGEK
jgi:pectate lyase